MTTHTDPEPWVHRWPNSEDEDIRSAEEQCVVKDCVASYEPRSKAELKRDLEKPSGPLHWWGILVGWFMEIREKLTR